MALLLENPGRPKLMPILAYCTGRMSHDAACVSGPRELKTRIGKGKNKGHCVGDGVREVGLFSLGRCLTLQVKFLF